MTKRFKTILIIMSIVLITVMATAIGLTAAIWESEGGSSEYGPTVDAVDWNSWTKYFIYNNILYENSVVGRAVTGYAGTNLGDVIFPVAGSGESPITEIRNTVFDQVTTKELPVTIYISRTIEEIEAASFSNLPNLQKVVFADGVEINVGAYCFAGCQSLKEIMIDCSSLDSTPRTVLFGDYALMGCTALTKITFNGTIAQWGALTHGTNWNAGTGDYKVYCSNGTLNKDGTTYTPSGD